MGRFLTTKAWYTDESDPFQRAPSVMTYDRAQQPHRHAGHARLGRGTVGRRRRRRVAGRDDESVRPAGQSRSRQARAVRRQSHVGPAAVLGRAAHVRREEEPLLLPAGSAAELPVPAGQLDDVDVVEQTGGGCRRSRLRLSARRRRVLDDVPAGAKPSRSGHDAEVGVVSRQGVQHGQVHDRWIRAARRPRRRRLRQRRPDERRHLRDAARRPEARGVERAGRRISKAR